MKNTTTKIRNFIAVHQGTNSETKYWSKNHTEYSESEDCTVLGFPSGATFVEAWEALETELHDWHTPSMVKVLLTDAVLYECTSVKYRQQKFHLSK